MMNCRSEPVGKKDKMHCKADERGSWKKIYSKEGSMHESQCDKETEWMTDGCSRGWSKRDRTNGKGFGLPRSTCDKEITTHDGCKKDRMNSKGKIMHRSRCDKETAMDDGLPK